MPRQLKVSDWPAGREMTTVPLNALQQKRLEDMLIESLKANLPENCVIIAVDLDVHFQVHHEAGKPPNYKEYRLNIEVDKGGKP